MWNRFKSAIRRVGAKRRSQRDLNRLLSQGDHVFRDIGLARVDVIRAKRDMNFL